MAGSQKPFSILYSDEIDRRWRSMLMTFFLKRLRNRTEAEDLTQETLVRGFRSCDICDIGTRSYLFKIATNLLRDRARRDRTHQSGSHTSFSDPSVRSEDMPAEELGQERVLIGRERLQQVLKALSELDERTRDIFILFRLEKMKQKEISALFGISVSAVEKHVVKATVHLSIRLDHND